MTKWSDHPLLMLYSLSHRGLFLSSTTHFILSHALSHNNINALLVIATGKRDVLPCSNGMLQLVAPAECKAEETRCPPQQRAGLRNLPSVGLYQSNQAAKMLHCAVAEAHT